MNDLLEVLADKLDNLLTSELAIPCELAHYTVVICGVKQTWGEDRARSQPFATWFMSLICCFGGSMLVNLFCGRPPLTPLTNNESLIYASLVWWLVFYFPRSWFHRLVQWMPISVTLLFFKEMIRTRKIIKGLTLGRAVYPSSFFLCTCLGMLGACGGGFIKSTALLLRSEWNEHSVKNFSFSIVTKCCLLFSALYNMQLDGRLSLTQQTVALMQFCVLYSVVIVANFGHKLDIFAPLEGMLSSILIDYSAFDNYSHHEKADSMKNPRKSALKHSPKHRKED